jgi:uncharacterized protein with GYD domain
MTKFMVRASYTAEGTKGLMKEGGSSRKATVGNLIKGLGGNMEVFYYAFGETDVYVICDLPDSATAVALNMVINATGAVKVSLIPLLNVEDVDAACKKSIPYRAPGA